MRRTPDDLASTIRTWTRGAQRAPHKPLLLLLALGRMARGEPRLVPFKEIEAPLKRLLREFGPTRASYHPEYPFWRLQSDGLWEVPGGEGLVPRLSNTDPPVTALRQVAGGLPIDLDARLRTDHSAVARFARALLDTHFPPTLHDSILAAVGLNLDATIPRPRKRDPQFREIVLRAYGYRCAVCGFDARLDGMTVSLDAAHVRWHSSSGPDVVENGLALCSLHHKALDLGLFTLTPDALITVSSRLHGGEAVEAHVGAYHGRPIMMPLHGHRPVAPVHIDWHITQVFKSPERGASR